MSHLGPARYPTTPQVAVFDTSFHSSLPAHSYMYAVPKDWYTTHHIRRYLYYVNYSKLW